MKSWTSFLDENAHVQLHMGIITMLFFTIFFFFFSFFPLGQCLPFIFYLLFFKIYWAGVTCFLLLLLLLLFFFFFFFCLDVIFLWTWFLFFNKFTWFFFFWVVYHFSYFNWTSFFNKSIYVNLYKLTFSIPNKIKMKEIKIFSMLLLFHSLTILYLYFFTPPIKQILKVFFFLLKKVSSIFF